MSYKKFHNLYSVGIRDYNECIKSFNSEVKYKDCFNCDEWIAL